MKRVFLSCLILLSFCANNIAQTQDTIKVMTYNLLFFPNPSNSDPIGNDASRADYFRQIIDELDPDIIICQEMTDISGATMLVNELNNNAATGKTYNHAPVFIEYGPSPWGIGNMLIYNDDLIDLSSQAELPRNNVGTASNGNTFIAPRANSLYVMDLESTECAGQTNELQIISGHFKAGTDGSNCCEISDRDRRNLSALDLMDYINSLNSTDNIIAGGDFNFYGDEINGSTYSEPAYVTVSQSSNANALIDIYGGFTRNTPSDVLKYSQSTRSGSSSNQYGNGGAPGGLDDRFDYLWHTDALESNLNSIELIQSTYEVIGNPLIWNGDAMDGTSPIKDILHWNSDHYPITVDIVSHYSGCANCPVSLFESIDYSMSENLEVEAEDLIEANNTIGAGATISYHAGQCVNLLAGFEVELGAEFHGYILSCNP